MVPLRQTRVLADYTRIVASVYVLYTTSPVVVVSVGPPAREPNNHSDI